MSEVSTNPTPDTAPIEKLGTVDLREFDLEYPEPYAQPATMLRWRKDAGDELEAFLATYDGGDNAGALLVRLAVDGHIDAIDADLAQSDDLEAIDRAIFALQRARAALDVPVRKVGRCMAWDDAGRCTLRTDHASGHEFPPSRLDNAVTALARPATRTAPPSVAPRIEVDTENGPAQAVLLEPRDGEPDGEWWATSSPAELQQLAADALAAAAWIEAQA